MDTFELQGPLLVSKHFGLFLSSFLFCLCFYFVSRAFFILLCMPMSFPSPPFFAFASNQIVLHFPCLFYPFFAFPCLFPWSFLPLLPTRFYFIFCVIFIPSFFPRPFDPLLKWIYCMTSSVWQWSHSPRWNWMQWWSCWSDCLWGMWHSLWYQLPRSCVSIAM